MKTLIHQLLMGVPDLGQRTSFAIDTLFTVLFLYLAIVKTVHGITKSFSLKVKKEPEFDIFQVSEYLHMWWSHLAMYILGFVILLFISVINLLYPFAEVDFTKNGFLIFLLIGQFLGLVIFFGVVNTKLKSGNFQSFMKILFALCSTVQALLYIFYRPAFSAVYLGYWFVSSTFLATVWCSLAFERNKFLRQIHAKFVPKNWGVEGR
jgi:hypothetical protein